MKTRKLADLFLYRRRYALGYGALTLLFLMAVVAAILYAPGGLTQAEIDMLGVTNQLQLGNISTYAIANLPLHLMQSAIFAVAGVSILTIKLPAALLSVIAAVSLFFLLRRWFKANVAVLSLLIMAATGQFIFIAQSFTPHILYVALTSLILLFATLIVQKASHGWLWKIGLVISVVTSLFTPFFWYINAGMFIVALIHPHTRHFLLARKYRKHWLATAGLFIVLLLPIVYLCISSPQLTRSLLGWSSLNFSLLENLNLLLHTYFWTKPTVVAGQITPILDFSALFLIILGFMRSFQQKHTARSYMIWAWLLLTLPLVVLNPALNIIATVPLFILLAVGVETLLREWYKLFPMNPYARGVGLVLIICLVGVMTLSGVDRYVHGYRYMPEAVNEVNNDLSIFKKIVPSGNTLLLVSLNEKPLYDAYASHLDSSIKVKTSIAASELKQGTIIVSHSARSALNGPLSGVALSQVLSNGRSEDADRFYVYKSAIK